jgi:ribonuclease G
LQKIIIHSMNHETRVAVTEDDQLVELMMERSEERRLVGSIYKGKVMNVLPGMQAAFVDIGIGKNGFLYIDDVLPANEAALPDVKPNINQLLTVGQEILVQVTKEPLGSKGARVTTHLSLPGRMLVYMPHADYVGVSRRIEDDQERERLRELSESIRQKGEGIIVRTVAEGIDEEEFLKDLHFLRGLWKKMMTENDSLKPPSCVYRDLDLTARTIRDLMTQEVERLVIDRRELVQRAQDLLTYISPHLVEKVTLYQGNEPIFHHFHIENELDKSLRRKVWLKSGGYLIIDHTEALTVIDVNTGKFTGHHDLEDTVVKTNLEAAKEAARQIRLRDIGGIIIIDFIDMVQDGHRSNVLEVLEAEFKKDRTKSHIYGLTRLGLVEMSRKKVRQNLEEILLCPCPVCDGAGKVLTSEAARASVERELLSYQASTDEAIWIKMNPSLFSAFMASRGSRLKEIEGNIGMRIYVSSDQTLPLGKYEIPYVGSEAEVRRRALPVEVGQWVIVTVEAEHSLNPIDGIGKINGYVIDVRDGVKYKGKQVVVRIDEVFPTYARGHVLYVQE